MLRSHVRQQIVEYLFAHGPIDDPSGRATTKLREAFGYEGSEQGFTQLIATMDRSRELTRVVKGKRTYRIAAVTAPSQTSDERVGTEDASDPSVLDYDELAAALLVRVVETITAGSGQREEEGAWARRRIERLERRIGELERELSRAKAESRGIADERDDLRRQLEHSEGNLAVLTDRLASRKPTQILNRLGTDEQVLLNQLRGSASRRRPDRAS
jgi:septal ring factor EnvC (AmiA/AmiB activator)